MTLPLGSLSLVCGANGSGKSNLYRSLALMAAAARGDLVAALAAEGGLPAVFWAGAQRSREPTRLRLGFAGTMLSYAIELGYHADDQTSAFLLDPEIKREWIWAGGPFHPRSLLVQREGTVVERHDDGTRAVADPLEAPARQSPLATRTPSLAADGSDLAAAVQTILEIGDRAGLQRALSDAFPGCRLSVDTSNPRFRLHCWCSMNRRTASIPI